MLVALFALLIALQAIQSIVRPLVPRDCNMMTAPLSGPRGAEITHRGQLPRKAHGLGARDSS
jgi:hypothetical protein